jgi:hypothetical protein
MDLTYVWCASCYFSSKDILKCNIEVTSANPRVSKHDINIDAAMESHWTISQVGKPDVRCYAEIDLQTPPLLGFIPNFFKIFPSVTIDLEMAQIKFENFVFPNMRHSITVTWKDDRGALTGRRTVEKVYIDGPQWGSRGKPWWTTYRWQLEAFVDMIRAKETGSEYHGPWMNLEESDKVMQVIDAVYDKAGLPRRRV